MLFLLALALGGGVGGIFNKIKDHKPLKCVIMNTLTDDNENNPKLSKKDVAYDLVRPKFKYLKEYGIVRDGKNILMTSETSSTDCIKQCEKINTCVGVLYDLATNACTLKSQMLNAEKRVLTMRSFRRDNFNTGHCVTVGKAA